jgi:TatA/E family protein of Tat protein translocase
MFGIGSGELLVIAIILLIAVGPDRMPTMMKAGGRALREFRKASQDLRRTVGIDELLRDDPPPRPVPPKEAPLPAVQNAETDTEFPSEGVDTAFAKKVLSDATPTHD